MARVQYGSFVTEMAGSIGGTSFQRNHSGNTARAKAQQKFFPSSLQSGTRNQFGRVSVNWSALTIEEQTGWNEFAALHPVTDRWGNVKGLSGFQYFVMVNRNLATLGVSGITLPGDYVGPTIITEIVAVGDGDNLGFDTVIEYDLTGKSVLVFATPPVRTSKLTNRKNLRLIKIYTEPELQLFLITSEWENIYGVNWAGLFATARCNVVIQIVVVDNATGIASPFTGAILSVLN
jgi:hypothetical protein